MELHGFSDAPEIEFAAAIYSRNTTKGTVHLLATKAEVTPLKDDKNITMLRLELCGAVFLAKLTKTVLTALEYDFQIQKYC